MRCTSSVGPCPRRSTVATARQVQGPGLVTRRPRPEQGHRSTRHHRPDGEQATVSNRQSRLTVVTVGRIRPSNSGWNCRTLRLSRSTTIEKPEFQRLEPLFRVELERSKIIQPARPFQKPAGVRQRAFEMAGWPFRSSDDGARTSTKGRPSQTPHNSTPKPVVLTESVRRPAQRLRVRYRWLDLNLGTRDRDDAYNSAGWTMHSNG